MIVNVYTMKSGCPVGHWHRISTRTVIGFCTGRRVFTVRRPRPQPDHR